MTNQEERVLEHASADLKMALDWLNERKQVDIETTTKIAGVITMLDDLLKQTDIEAIEQAAELED